MRWRRKSEREKRIILLLATINALQLTKWRAAAVEGAWIFDGSIYFAKVNLHRLIDDARRALGGWRGRNLSLNSFSRSFTVERRSDKVKKPHRVAHNEGCWRIRVKSVLKIYRISITSSIHSNSPKRKSTFFLRNHPWIENWKAKPPRLPECAVSVN